jgi:hypothetical protein
VSKDESAETKEAAARKKFIDKQIAKPREYRRIFKTEAGKNVLNDLIDTHFVMRPTIDKDSHTTAYNEGQRMVILRILTMLNTDPEAIKQRIEESNNYVSNVVD